MCTCCTKTKRVATHAKPTRRIAGMRVTLIGQSVAAINKPAFLWHYIVVYTHAFDVLKRSKFFVKMSTSVTFYLRGEISTATNFEAESLFLSYCILIPNGKLKNCSQHKNIIWILNQSGVLAMKINYLEWRISHRWRRKLLAPKENLFLWLISINSLKQNYQHHWTKVCEIYLL